MHRDDVLGRHPHVVQDDGAAGGGALAEAGPVVDHRQPRRVARDERQVRALLGVEADGRYPVGEQGAARIELAAVDAEPVAIRQHSCLEFGDGTAVAFGEGVAEAHAV